jgi:hypothetical protein
MRCQFDRTGTDVFRPHDSSRPFTPQPKLFKLDGLFFLSSLSFVIVIIISVIVVALLSW